MIPRRSLGPRPPRRLAASYSDHTAKLPPSGVVAALARELGLNPDTSAVAVADAIEAVSHPTRREALRARLASARGAT